MKLHILSVIVAALVAGGCSQSEPSTPSDTNENSTAQSNQGDSGGRNPLSAPADYVGAISRAKQTAEKTVGTSSLNQALRMFYSQEGRYPQELSELVSKNYLPRLPEPPRGMQYQYDPQSGEVKVVQP